MPEEPSQSTTLSEPESDAPSDTFQSLVNEEKSKAEDGLGAGSKIAERGRTKSATNAAEVPPTSRRPSKRSLVEAKKEETRPPPKGAGKQADRVTTRRSKTQSEPSERTQAAEEAPRKKRRKNSPGPDAVDGSDNAVLTDTPHADLKEEKARRERKTRDEQGAEAMPLAHRTVGLKHFIGAHVSSAGGVHKSVGNAVHIGGNAFAMFLKSQRKWQNPALQDEHRDSFKSGCSAQRFDSARTVVPHGSYLVNLAHSDPERTEQAYTCFLDDLVRCKELGIQLYNFHPGNCASSNREDGIARIAAQLNRAHRDPTTGTVITLLETMAGTGNVLGGKFQDLRDVIDLVDMKNRVGVCLDTCHIFAAGYDLRTPAAFGATVDEFDKVIGLNYLKALHVNDSKAPLASNRDIHANIGTGFLGLRSFHSLMCEKRLHGLPFVLETPTERVDKDGKKFEDKSVWAREIKLLESLASMELSSKEFLELEVQLTADGEKERGRIQEQVDRKIQKDDAKKRRKIKS